MNNFTYEERRDRARAFGMQLRQKVIVLRASLSRGQSIRSSSPASVARAAHRVRGALFTFDAALRFRAPAPARIELARAELEVARLLLEIEQLGAELPTAA